MNFSLGYKIQGIFIGSGQNYSSITIPNPKRWCHQGIAFNMSANLEDSTVATGLEKINIPIPKKNSTNKWANHQTIASHASKVVLKVLHARLQRYENQELPDVQAVLKERETRDQIGNSHWIIDKAREFQRNISTSVSSTVPKPLAVWIMINWGSS